jgi:hypothetical protein
MRRDCFKLKLRQDYPWRFPNLGFGLAGGALEGFPLVSWSEDGGDRQEGFSPRADEDGETESDLRKFHV